MHIDAVNKIEAFYKRNAFNEALQETITPVLLLVVFMSSASLFVDLSVRVWL